MKLVLSCAHASWIIALLSACQILVGCRSRGEPRISEWSEAAGAERGLLAHGTFQIDPEPCSMDAYVRAFYKKSQRTWGDRFGKVRSTDARLSAFFDRFPNPDGLVEYVNLDAKSKQDLLYAFHAESLQRAGGVLERNPVARTIDGGRLLIETGYFVIPPENRGAREIVHTMTRVCDVLERPRLKQVHGLGTLAPGRLVIDSSSVYSGLLAAGASVPLLIRFSLANPVHNLKTADARGLPLEFIPGIGVKLLVDGRRSENFVAMESLAGQSDLHNFFLHDFSNDFSANSPIALDEMRTEIAQLRQVVIRRPELKPFLDRRSDVLSRYENNALNLKVMQRVARAFTSALSLVNVQTPFGEQTDPNRGNPSPFNRTIRRLTWVTPEGEDVPESDRRWPARILLRPSPGLCGQTFTWEAQTVSVCSAARFPDFRKKLAAIAPGTEVYQVIAVERGSSGARFDDAETHIGHIVLEASPQDSQWGDREFFIQHDQ